MQISVYGNIRYIEEEASTLHQSGNEAVPWHDLTCCHPCFRKKLHETVYIVYLIFLASRCILNTFHVVHTHAVSL